MLVTRFLTEGGVGELIGFMPITGDATADQHRLVRMLRCVRGQISFDVEVAPRFDDGRRPHHLSLSEDGAIFDGGEQGQTRGVVLDVGSDVVPRRMRPSEVQETLDDTAHFWHDRLSRSTYTGRCREELQRSAITPKLLTYAPQVGFLSPTDPMWQSTLRAMDTGLASDSLVYRYDPSASPDGLLGSEGTFSLCTFRYVDALAGAGRVDEARLTFEKMLTSANHLGLYSEEIAVTGEQIGNFPQAFTHLALIDAAITLNDCLDDAAHQPGRPGRRPRRAR